MKRFMVRYTVKADRAGENEAYIARVFEQLDRERPTGIRYASFKCEDGVSFVHIVSVERADDRNPLTELSAFRDFTARIRERSEDLPVATELREIGSYGFFSA